MRARHLIDHASFGPDALKVIGDAFDAAWAEIAGWFGTDPLVIEAARLRLADAVLSVASEHGHEVEALKRAALQRMEQLHQTTSRRQRQHGIPQKPPQDGLHLREMIATADVLLGDRQGPEEENFAFSVQSRQAAFPVTALVECALRARPRRQERTSNGRSDGARGAAAVDRCSNLPTDTPTQHGSVEGSAERISPAW